MTTVVVHSFMRDSRKANLTAQLAALSVAEGRQTGVVEADVLVPELHTKYRLDAGGMGPTFNDYLMDRCALEDAAIKLDSQGGLTGTGALVFVPSSADPTDRSGLLQQRVDVTKLDAGFSALTEAYNLDLLFVNAPAGLDEISLSCIALADVLIVALRLDKEDTHGTSVILDLAQRLNVPEVLLVVARVSDEYDPQEVRREVEAAYGYRTPVVLTVADESEMMFAGRTSTLDKATNPLAALLKAIHAQA